MTSSQLKLMPGKILVKKLADDTTTKAGIILTSAANKKHEYVEIIKTGKNISDDMNLKITVTEGQHCIVLGRGIYDSVELDDGLHYFINPADIVAVINN